MLYRSIYWRCQRCDSFLKTNDPASRWAILIGYIARRIFAIHTDLRSDRSLRKIRVCMRGTRGTWFISINVTQIARIIDSHTREGINTGFREARVILSLNKNHVPKNMSKYRWKDPAYLPAGGVSILRILSPLAYVTSLTVSWSFSFKLVMDKLNPSARAFRSVAQNTRLRPKFFKLPPPPVFAMLV